MPVSKYFHGKGSAVMKDFVKRYGEERGRKMFYAVANKRGLAPKKKKVRRRK